MNDDPFVWLATAIACFMDHLVGLFMKMHLLTLLQDNCLDLVHCAFLHKLSTFCQHLLRLIYDISVKPKYRSISIDDC